MTLQNYQKWIAGVAFTFFIALLGFLLAIIPGFNVIVQLASAIIIAVIYLQLFGYPVMLREGTTFSTKKLLRLAIILYGLKLNVAVIFEDGLGLLFRDALVIIFASFATLALANLFKADRNLSLLLGLCTGVCGAAAIAAVAPIVKAKEEDTAIGVGIIALIGTFFAILYTILHPILNMLPTDYGIWSGSSLHELAHVAIAAAPAGEDALAVGLLAKLGRVFLLVPLCFILIYLMSRKNKATTKQKVDFPWFLIGFIALSIFGTYVLGEVIPFSEN